LADKYQRPKRERASDGDEDEPKIGSELPIASDRAAVDSTVSSENECGGVELENRGACVDVAGREPYAFVGDIKSDVPAVVTGSTNANGVWLVDRTSLC